MTLRRALFACAIALAALLPASVRAQIQPGGAVLIDKTPIVGGTTGRCLYDNAGKIGETASCGLAGGITVGTSVITGGTTTRVLYDNAGVLGEYTNTQLTALINPATASLSGALPAWPNNTTTFFRGDGSYQTLNCAALTNGASGCSTAVGTIATQAYVSGTCTPTFAGASTAGTGQTYAANGQVCFYEQIAGRLVTLRLWINASSMGTASGNLLIKGLPITADATTNNFGGCVSTFYSVTGLTASNFGVTGLIRPSTTQIEVYAGSSTLSNAITVAQAGASAVFAMTCTYQS